MENLTPTLEQNIQKIQTLLPVPDLLVFRLTLPDNTPCAVLYIDGISNKDTLGELVAKPLSIFKEKVTLENIQTSLAAPESKPVDKLDDIVKEVLDGNPALLVDGLQTALALGLKTVPVRAVAEPPTDIAIKGPRTGFIEDIKTNLSLLRTRLKTPDLRFLNVTVGRRSQTKIAVCYLENIAKKSVVKEIENTLKKIDVDGIPDSSYISLFLAKRKRSIFKQSGTTEKPDVLAAKMLEGRVGILVDGSPIAITLPYLIVEDFQSSEDYFVSPYRASFTRFIRLFSLLLSIYLPAFYVAAQLFKLQILPLGILLTVASNVQGLSLSPSMEMFLTVLVLEVLTEASVRMPKYVGMALSVVGALVLGDTAVNAGFLSTPAILIVALSGICLYTVPNLIETTSLIRILMLLVAGSTGAYGIILLTAFLLYYLFSSESYGSPLLAPFTPVITHDLRDSIVKFNLQELTTRPQLFESKNKTRLQNAQE